MRRLGRNAGGGPAPGTTGPEPPEAAPWHPPWPPGVRGWEILPKALIGGPPEAPLRVDVAALHPARGIALIDIAPRTTPRAAETLRRALRAAGSGPLPPVAYICLAAEEVPDLSGLLKRALPGGASSGGWMAAAREVLAGDAPPARDTHTGPSPEALAQPAPATGPRRWRARAVVLTALAALVTATILLPSPPAPVPSPVVGLPLPRPASVPDATAGATTPPAPAVGHAEPPHATLPPPATPPAPAAGHAEPADATVPPPAATPPGATPPADLAGGFAAPLDAMVPPPPAADRTAPGTLVPEEEPLREPETVAGVVAPPGIDEAPRPAVATRLAPAAAPSRPMSPVGARCAPLLARLQLGETPTHEERQRLRSECAPRP